jgi:hypothetical protein
MVDPVYSLAQGRRPMRREHVRVRREVERRVVHFVWAWRVGVVACVCIGEGGCTANRESVSWVCVEG